MQGVIADKSSLGVLNDGLTLGYNLHGSIVLDSNYESRGISNALTYRRAFPNSEESKKIRLSRRDDLPIDQKESYRWVLGVKKSTDYLGNPLRLTFIFDREGDIYELLDEIDKQDSKFIARSQHNRRVELPDGKTVKLTEHIEQQPIKHKYTVSVAADERGNKRRIANLALKYTEIRIKAPTHYSFETTYSSYLDITLVQAKEIIEPGQAIPDNLILWNILTNSEVQNNTQGMKIVENYSSRWCIEDVFRGTKNKGLQLDSSTLENGKALRKLAIMAFDISSVALKLRQAREGKNHTPIQEVFEQSQVECMEQLCSKLEGNTEKQRNPHKSDSLAWAAWIIARLGGWSGFQSQRPPGIITMKRGLESFSSIYIGWSIRMP